MGLALFLTVFVFFLGCLWIIKILIALSLLSRTGDHDNDNITTKDIQNYLAEAAFIFWLRNKNEIKNKNIKYHNVISVFLVISLFIIIGGFIFLFISN